MSSDSADSSRDTRLDVRNGKAGEMLNGKEERERNTDTEGE